MTDIDDDDWRLKKSYDMPDHAKLSVFLKWLLEHDGIIGYSVDITDVASWVNVNFRPGYGPGKEAIDAKAKECGAL